MNKICVIGSLNIDLTCNVENLPKKGETILADDFVVNCGGKGANQAYSAAKLNGNVVMLGCVGNDEYGDLLLKNLSQVNVDVSRIKKVHANTGTAFINVDKDGHNSIVVSQGANKYCLPEYILENLDVIKESSYILVQMEIPFETIELLKDIAVQNNIKFILNPAPIPKVVNNTLFDGTYLLIPNETELSGITSSGLDLDKKIEEVLNKGVENLIVTLGERGAIYKNKDLNVQVKAFKVEAIDTVAAGDCFCGALTVALSEGKNFENAIKFASASSGIAVTRNGAQASIPSREEVDYFLKNMEE